MSLICTLSCTRITAESFCNPRFMDAKEMVTNAVFFSHHAWRTKKLCVFNNTLSTELACVTTQALSNLRNHRLYIVLSLLGAKVLVVSISCLYLAMIANFAG